MRQFDFSRRPNLSPPVHARDHPQPPRTSVIITSYNYAEYLPVAMASVLSQTDQDLELLVVDDGSTDDSVAVAQTFQDPRVVVLAGSHRGIGSTRNRGVRVARGRYIAFLDADDLWTPDKLTVQCRWLESHPHTGCVYSRFGVIDVDAQILSRGHSCFGSKPSGWILRQLLVGNCIGTPSTICVRRELFERERLRFDETDTFAEDWHFYLSMACRTEISYIPRTLAYHRQHARNISGSVMHLFPQVLRTGLLGLTLAKLYLSMSERQISYLRTRMKASADAFAGREYVKTGDLVQAIPHIRRSLSRYPWSPREIVLALLASSGWIPNLLVRRLK